MNIERFYEIESEIVKLVETTVVAIKEKSFEDYVLLLIHADFYEIIDSKNFKKNIDILKNEC